MGTRLPPGLQKHASHPRLAQAVQNHRGLYPVPEAYEIAAARELLISHGYRVQNPPTLEEAQQEATDEQIAFELGQAILSSRRARENLEGMGLQPCLALEDFQELGKRVAHFILGRRRGKRSKVY